MANTEETNLILALCMGTLALLVMAVAIIAFVMFYQRRIIAHKLEIKTNEEAMQKELLRATIQSQEEEQRRIARDLHDDLGPMLSAVKLKISLLSRRLTGENLNPPELIDSKDMLDITIQQVRGISHRLLPPVLEEYGLANAIENTCQKMSHVNFEILFNCPAEFARMANDTELALYRVIMELLNNTVKHSQATRVEINFKQKNSIYEITVFDNGIGFDATMVNAKTGLGLKNIQSRLNAINATITYNSSPGNTVAIIKPFVRSIP